MILSNDKVYDYIDNLVLSEQWTLAGYDRTYRWDGWGN
jgi:3',5'-cyclic AMP phosphodiesterase CpdA